jgi:outer membrane lipoprotein SlyB
MPAPVASAANAIVLSLCDTCGVVQTLQQEKRKGKGGALGVAGGAVAGGLLGKQIGGGDGKTLATVGGAVGGALIGNEIQKKLNSKKVWVTTVKMKDGSIKTVEQEAQPAWAVGQVLKAQGAGFAKL